MAVQEAAEKPGEGTRSSPRALKCDTLSPTYGTTEVVDEEKLAIAALKSVRENSVVPPGLESILPFYPALKRWAKLGRPSGAAFSCAWFHQTARKRVLTHTLKRCPTQNQVQR